MRWTFQLLILVHLLITTQCIARPTSVAVGGTDVLRLARREPSHANGHKRGRSDVSNGSRGSSKKRPKSHGSRSRSPRRTSPSPNRQRTPTPPPPPKKDPHQIKAKNLKTRRYRKVAIEQSHTPKGKWPGVDADHILEAQTVSKYLNEHRNGQPVGKPCIDAIKAHLNAPENVKLLDHGDNHHKGIVVSKLMNKKEADKFTEKAKDHIMKNEGNLRKTANNIDGLFTKGAKCGHIKPKKPDGIHDIADRMIKHAQNS